MKNPQAVYLEGVSNYLQIDGSIVENNEDVMGSSPKFSKSFDDVYVFRDIYKCIKTNKFYKLLELSTETLNTQER